MADEKLIKSFHAMWNNFPGAVRLIQKDRLVVAVNTAAEEAGIKTGVRCFEISSSGMHKDCLANKALSDKRGISQLSDDGRLVRYWIPVDGCKDLFVHYVVPVSNLLPSTSDDKA